MTGLELILHSAFSGISDASKQFRINKIEKQRANFAIFAKNF